MRIHAREPAVDGPEGDVGRPRALPGAGFLRPALRIPAFGVHGGVDPDPRRVAARLAREPVELLDRGPALVARGGARVDDPTVAEAGGAPDRDRLERSEPDRDGALHGRRVDPDVAQPVPAALEGDEILAPEAAQDLHLLLHPPAPIAEVLVQGLELDRVPADADAEARAPAAEDVELGRLLGDQRGLALRQDEDRGGELDALGDRRQVGEEQERFMEHPLPRVELRPRGTARDARAEHVVDRGQVVEPEPFHRLDVVPDDGRIGPDLGLRKDRSHSHRSPPSAFVPSTTASIARFRAAVNPAPTARCRCSRRTRDPSTNAPGKRRDPAGEAQRPGASAYAERADFLPPTALPPTARPEPGVRFVLDCAARVDDAAQGADAARMIRIGT